MKSAKQKKSMRTSLFILLTVLSLFVSLVGCSSFSFVQEPDENGGAPTDTPSPDSQQAISPTQPQPTTYYNRYTGLACDEAFLSCRPISVCIGNFDENRQSGLSFADILIEAPIDGEKTRLWAISTAPSLTTTLSGVASVRDYMMPSLKAFGAIGAYAGTTDTVGATASVYDGDNLDYIYHNLTDTFKKDETGTLTTTGIALQGAAAGRGYSLTDTECTLPYRFAELGKRYTPSGNTVRSISFRYSMANTIKFTYNEETGVYTREQKGAEHIDSATGNALTFANILLLFHNVNYYHTATETSFSLDTESGGDGYLYTGGGVVTVRWRYTDDGALSILTDDGEVITVNRGKTYIGMLRVTDSTSLIAK